MIYHRLSHTTGAWKSLPDIPQPVCGLVVEYPWKTPMDNYLS